MTDLDTNDPDAVWARHDPDAPDVGWGPVLADGDGTVVPADAMVDAADAADAVAEAPEPDGPTLVGRRTWLAEGGLAVGALVLFAWSLARNGYGNSYYAAAARSMTQSWSNFFFGALDPGGWITVDKPPAALWFQAAFAKVFGFSSWSLLLPSAIAGAAAVWLLTITVRRVWGRTAGFVAGFAMALTPAVLAVSRSNNPDGVLMLAVVAAAFATERSITTRKARWMYLAGGLCGFAFLTKLLAAGLVMPGMWLAYLLAAKHSWRRRIGHLLLAAASFVGVAGVWVGAVQLTPASSRPYIGGSTDGTALDLIVGYNGLGRVTGNENGPGGGGGPGGGARPGGFGGAAGGSGTFTVDEFGGTPGIGRLFNNGMGDQVMWLAPVAGAAVLAGAAYAVRRRRIDSKVGSVALFAGWAAVTYVVFAFAEGIYHNYYVSLLAPAVAALVGIGAAMALKAGRLGRVVVVGVLAATALLQLSLLRRIPAYTWLRVVVPVGLALAALAWIGLAVRRTSGRKAVLGTLVATGGVALLAPAVWAWSGTQSAQNGTFPDARPAVAGSGTGFGGGAPTGTRAGGPGGFGGGGLDAQLLTWLRSQRTTETWLVAVNSSMQASSAIIAGDSVMAMGGFSGSDQAMTQRRLAELVAKGELRYVLGGGGGFGGPGGGGGANVTGIVSQACTSVPASTWGGTSGTLYDCQGKADAIRTVEVTATTGGQGRVGANAGGQPPTGGQGFPGGGAGGAGGPGAPSAEVEACLQASGVSLPDPTSGGAPPALNDPTTMEAVQACFAAA